MLLKDFNSGVGREDAFKLKIGDVSLHKCNDDQGVTVVNHGYQEWLREQCSQITEVHKCTSTSPGGKTLNQTGNIFKDGSRHQIHFKSNLSQGTMIFTTFWLLQMLQRDY
jgi:hypothetical protein